MRRATPLTLDLTVEPPARPSEDDLLDRLALAARATRRRTPRQQKAAIAPGDDVVLELLSYVDGEVLPGGAHEALPFIASPAASIPELGVQLPGLQVGGSAQLAARFPLDYPHQRAAGRRAIFLMTVKQAAAVAPIRVRDLLQPGGLWPGATPEQVLSALAAQLVGERQRAYEERCRRAALVALASRCKGPVPPPALEAEVQRRWQQQDGRVLRRLGLSDAELAGALARWRADPEVRAEVERDLKALTTMRELVQGGALALEAADLVPGMVSYLWAIGATNEGQARTALALEAASGSMVVDAIVIRAALDRLLAGAALRPR